MTLVIKTDNQERELCYFCDFKEAEQQQLRQDYDWMEHGLEANFGFFCYNNSIYHLQDFTSLHDGNESEHFKDWDGIIHDTYFSGIVIKLADDNESVIVGSFYG